MNLSLKQIVLAVATLSAVGSSGVGFSVAHADEGSGLAVMVPNTVRDPVTQESRKECTILTPDQRAGGTYGMSKEQLMQLSVSNQPWVQWYLGGTDRYNQIVNPALGSNDANIRRATNWARCESMAKFIRIVNKDLFKTKIVESASSMVCKGSPYTYSFQTVGNHVQMDITWAAAPVIAPARPVPGALAVTIPATSRPISHEKVQIVRTGDSSCPLRVTQTAPNSKKIRMCLPLTPQNEVGEGSVSMHIAGRDIPAEQQPISCQPDENFMKIAMRAPSKIPHSVTVSEAASGSRISR